MSINTVGSRATARSDPNMGPGDDEGGASLEAAGQVAPLPRERPREPAQQDTETGSIRVCGAMPSCRLLLLTSKYGILRRPKADTEHHEKMIHEGRHRGCERAHTCNGPFLTGGGVMALWVEIAMTGAPRGLLECG